MVDMDFNGYQRGPLINSLWLTASCWRSLRVSGPFVENLRHGAVWKECWKTERSSRSRLTMNLVGRVSRSRIQEAISHDNHMMIT